MRRVLILCCITILVFGLTGCKSDKSVVTEETTETTEAVRMRCKTYDDLRLDNGEERVLKEGEYNPDDIYTYCYNDKVILEGSEELQKDILEEAKNPGLGISKLQAEGLTGKGINVAIIDQNMLLDNPEFKDKIVDYYDTGCEMPEDRGSYHGAAVTGVLVGETVGVAPDAKVYYVAVPSWKKDSGYYAKALDWVIEKNASLSEDEKIRLVSISAAPCGKGTAFNSNTEMYKEAVKRAQDAGILVLDCSDGENSGIILPAFYDPEDREDPAKCKGGFPNNQYMMKIKGVCAPCSYRTVCEQYEPGAATYRYDGVGGLSWGVPYAAGVLALGWQENPTLNKDEIVKILLDTAVTGADGNKIINPIGFIDTIKKGM